MKTNEEYLTEVEGGIRKKKDGERGRRRMEGDDWRRMMKNVEYT